MNRLLNTWHSVNGATPVLLAKNEYNEIGQLVDKKLHSADNGTTFKQSNDYRYNIRGWLTSINDSQLAMNSNNDDNNDLFGMNLSYNDVINGVSNEPQFNGNISAIKWSNNLALGATKDVAYKYTYDAMNRISSASYLTNPGSWNASSNFAENGLSYDLNGNILSLTRTDASGTMTDNLTYNYIGQGNTSNQLKSVTDTGDKLKGFADGNIIGDDYSYDVNGNMIADKNKSLTAITYNHLNLPQQVTKASGEKIVYIYNAGGKKLMQKVYDVSGAATKKMDYDGEFIYQNDTLQFINHEEGRVVMKPLTTGEVGIRPEYQYHLKDHLGNVRVTFTSAPLTQQNVATFETANVNVEQSKFLRYTNAKRIYSAIFDKTKGSDLGYSERLSGSLNEKYGLAKSISVMPGDVINTEVYAKYVDPSAIDNTTTTGQELLNLLTQIANSTAGVVVDGTAYTSSTSSFPIGFGSLLDKTDNEAPKAYLNWLVFDKNFAFLTGGFKQITTVAKEAGADVPHEYLSSGDITITQPGYVYIYLSNESTSTVEVYFDDFKVTQNNSPVVQQEDFYPFGLSFNKYSREGSVPNTMKLFQDQEHIDDLGLNWDSFKWRNHMPDIGRFFNIDPLAEKYVYNSTYAFSENQVVAHRELEGLEKWDIKYSDGSTGAEYGPHANQQSAEKYHDDHMMISPVESPLVNSGLGAREAPVKGASTNHQGSDIIRADDGSKTNGTKVVADINGKIEIKSKDDGNAAGNRISITSSDGKQHNFFHLQDGAGKGLTNGQMVTRGTKIGNVGSTGGVSGPHLHYEIRKTPWGTALNPVKENPALATGAGNKTIVPMVPKAPTENKFSGVSINTDLNKKP